ncbi:hypothetical protein REJ26_002352 [Providencia stuartii]|uniref:hypothetical protein n=1 Tax=Providencia TaxID=586 RepID=UPI00293FD47D|nr:hypothetical protein [Providencia sp. 2023EL-00965]ELR5300717.1 hypothetical protein [Providencia stuartii]MDW7589660.1 hypothetical protein [Providencia sp. 2023EL-00965]
MSDFKNIMDFIEDVIKYFFDPEKRSFMLLAVAIFFSYRYEFFTGVFYKIKNKKLNELSFYRDKVKSETTTKYINAKIDEVIERRVTKISDYKERNIFMFVSSRIEQWSYGDIVLRNIISYISVGRRFRIDFKKYKKNRSGYVTKFVFYLIAMVITIAISFYFKLYEGSEYGFFIPLIVMGFFEILALNNYNKIFRVKHLKEYNNALVKIDASAFKLDQINDSSSSATLRSSKSSSLATPPPAKASPSRKN